MLGVGAVEIVGKGIGDIGSGVAGAVGIHSTSSHAGAGGGEDNDDDDDDEFDAEDAEQNAIDDSKWSLSKLCEVAVSDDEYCRSSADDYAMEIHEEEKGFSTDASAACDYHRVRMKYFVIIESCAAAKHSKGVEANARLKWMKSLEANRLLSSSFLTKQAMGTQRARKRHRGTNVGIKHPETVREVIDAMGRVEIQRKVGSGTHPIQSNPIQSSTCDAMMRCVTMQCNAMQQRGCCLSVHTYSQSLAFQDRLICRQTAVKRYAVLYSIVLQKRAYCTKR